ncbi:MAG: 50S ribosomal protein L15 [bacterium]|nr:50S ribosomal protein L15 [bacterium]
MKFNELIIKSSRKKSRVGRGIAAGQGKTAGRGTKGQGSRAGTGRRPGFEGGQNPLMQRLPKLRGFRTQHTKAEVIYTGQLSAIKGTVDNFSLFDAGLVSSPYTKVKLVTKGEVTTKVSVKLQFATASAIEAVKKAGGTFEKTDQVKRATKKPAEA